MLHLLSSKRAYKHFGIFLFITIVCIIHFRWFSAAIFVYGDWPYRFRESLLQALSPSTWAGDTSYGSPNILLWRLPLNILFGLLEKSGIGFVWSEKILALWPTIIGLAVGGYLLGYKIYHSRLSGCVVATVMLFNTYTMASIGQGHILLPTATAVSLFSFVAFLCATEKTKSSLWLYALCGLLISVSGWIDLRILYMSFAVIGLLALYTFIGKRIPRQELVKGLSIIFIIVLLSSAFWVLPAMTGGEMASSNVLGRILFGNQYWNIQSALTFNHPFWNGHETIWFTKQTPPIYSWAVPIAALIALILHRKKNDYLILFSIVSIIGILLSKQVDEPFSSLYPWLFQNVPGFSAFRESTKFYFFSIIGLSVISGALAIQTGPREGLKKYIRTGALACLLLVFLWNASMILTGSAGKLYTSRNMPDDYKILREYLKKDDGFFRTLWIPAQPHWIFSSNTRPFLTMSAVNDEWTAFLPDDIQKMSERHSYKKFSALLNTNAGEHLFRNSAVKYFIIPAEDNKDDVMFNAYSADRKQYQNLLASTPYLQPIDIGTKSLKIYKNNRYEPHISTTDSILKLSKETSIQSAANYLSRMSQYADFIQDERDSSPPELTDIGSSAKIVSQDNKMQLQYKVPEKSRSHELIVDNRPSTLDYKVEKNYLLLSSLPNSLLNTHDGTSVHQPAPPKQISRLPIRSINHSYLMIGDNGLLPLYKDTAGKIHYPTAETPVKIVRMGRNFISNPNFSNGAWQEKVSDCNNYDDQSRISQEITGTNKGLALRATRHIACTNQEFSVDPEKDMILDFRYTAKPKTMVGYYIDFGKAHTPVSDTFESLSDGLSDTRHTIRFKTPDDISKATLYFYSYESDRNTENTVIYDDIAVGEYAVESSDTIHPDHTPYQNKRVLVGNADSAYTIGDETYTYENLIPNPDFSDGPWTPSVQDCFNYDSRPSIRMDVLHDSPNAIRLSSRNHNACTSTSFRIDPSSYALFKFRYSHKHSNAGYYIQFNDPAKTFISDVIEEKKDDTWQNYERRIKIPDNATHATLHIYSYAPGAGKEGVAKYTNFYFSTIPAANSMYYMRTESDQPLSRPKNISIREASTTTKYINMTLHGTTYLKLNEHFNKNWKLFLLPTKHDDTRLSSFVPIREQAVSPTIKANELINLWKIDTNAIKSTYSEGYYKKNDDGSLTLRLMVAYTPQRFLNIGLLISSASVIATMTYIILAIHRQRREITKPIDSM